MSTGIFIVAAGEGARLPYNIGKKIPKCLLPISLIDTNYRGSDLIIDRIIKLINESVGKKQAEINIMISNTDPLISNYLETLADNITVNVIEWHESSINTLKHCDSIIKSKNYKRCMFINGDMFISDVAKVISSAKKMFAANDVCLVENHRSFKYLWSSVVCDDKNKLLSIYPDYVFTTNNLCDMSFFSRKTYERIVKKINDGFSHPWWEMAFIQMINNKELEVHAVFINDPDGQALLSNINNISPDLSKKQVYVELKTKMSFMEERFNDFKD